MIFFPFFLECSMKEIDLIKKKHLELLAFGKAGVMISNLYVTENGNFIIPRNYSDEERDKLYQLIWNETEFSQMEKKIKEHFNTWKNLKKSEKLRMIDKYVLTLDCDFEENKKISGELKNAFITKSLSPQDIVYENFQITQIKKIENEINNFLCI